ncbi:MAG TPA: hypothetical protein VFK19_09440 [Sphingomicrobium sp.]|nr:hypothetical protein [Sphingomicrobium sp.]
MSILLAALLLSTDPAAAASAPSVATPPPASQPAAKPKKQKEKKICRTVDDATGSRMIQRTCLTQEQWDARAGRTADQVGTIPSNH